MSRPTEPLRAEHAAFVAHIDELRAVARSLPDLDPAERSAALAPCTAFLRETLIPHAQLEEAVLYPAWSRMVGYAYAAQTMIHDHAAIVARIERLERADPADTAELQELLYGLHALITVHFDAEERIQLDAFDAEPAAAAALLEDLHAAHRG